MSWLGRLLGFGGSGPAPVTALADATAQVAEVFTENKTRRMELTAEQRAAALAQFAAEFGRQPTGWFDRFVDGLNRLPRPMMALGTLGLFVFAWENPDAFAERMLALQTIPEPLWWLLGAIVSFYFGARESFHWRSTRAQSSVWPGLAQSAENPSETTEENPALSEWIAKNEEIRDDQI
jgi:hypothetical protein